jgi:hypothetical protein
MSGDYMNERIKDLEKLATPRCYDETGCYIGNRFDPKKFAELIVRECAGVGYDASYYECALNVSNKIKEHFGVEE